MTMARLQQRFTLFFCVCLFSLEKIICQNKYLVFLVKKHVLNVHTKTKELKAPTRRRKQKAKAFVTKKFLKILIINTRLPLKSYLKVIVDRIYIPKCSKSSEKS